MDVFQAFLLRYPSLDATKLRDYLEFLASRSPAPLGTYGEVHHVLPKSLFPEYRKPREHSWNSIRLLASDHFIAHYHLFRLFSGIEHRMVAAWYVLWANKYQQLSPELLAGYAQEYQTAKIQPSRYMKTRKCSDATRAKMSESAKVKAFSTEHRSNMSKAKQGHVQSEETKKKIGDAQRGIPRGPRDPKVSEAAASKLRGRKQAPEQIAKAVAGRKTPRAHTEETRQKMRESSARRWAKPGARAAASASALTRTKPLPQPPTASE